MKKPAYIKSSDYSFIQAKTLWGSAMWFAMFGGIMLTSPFGSGVPMGVTLLVAAACQVLIGILCAIDGIKESNIEKKP